MTEDEAVIFYAHDVLGSPVAVSDEQGRVLWYENTQPYGKSLNRYSPDGQGLLDNAAEQTLSRVGYTGHQSDTETGLVYMKARYYDPHIGRFYSNDPIGFIKNNSGRFNRYGYVYDNPINLTDPTGAIPSNDPTNGLGVFGCSDGSCDYRQDNKEKIEEDGIITIEEASFNYHTDGYDLDADANVLEWEEDDNYGEVATAKPGSFWDFVVHGTVSFSSMLGQWQGRSEKFDFGTKQGKFVRNFMTNRWENWVNTPDTDVYGVGTIGLQGLEPTNVISRPREFTINYSGLVDIHAPR